MWRVQLDQRAARLGLFTALLSEAEYLRAGRYHFAIDRDRFIQRRGFLRLILGHYLGGEPGQLRFAVGSHGKPALSFPAGTGLHFNLSHSSGLVLYAVTRGGEIGIDVERVRDIKEAESIATHFFSARDVAELRSLPKHERPEAFLKGWTCLEACAKASGRGIAETPNPVRVLLAHRQADRVLNWRENFHTPTSLLYDLLPAPGYVATLAYQRLSANSDREPH